MAKFVGELLFRMLWDFAEQHAIRQIDRKAGPWLATKLSRRAALVAGFLLGLAAWGVWPLLAFWLAR
jgi:hypothetical protein